MKILYIMDRNATSADIAESKGRFVLNNIPMLNYFNELILKIADVEDKLLFFFFFYNFIVN